MRKRPSEGLRRAGEKRPWLKASLHAGEPTITPQAASIPKKPKEAVVEGRDHQGGKRAFHQVSYKQNTNPGKAPAGVEDATKSDTDGNPDVSAEGEKTRTRAKELNRRLDTIQREAGYKSEQAFVIPYKTELKAARAHNLAWKKLARDVEDVAEAEEAEKSEGERGGHITEHTKSGKPIYGAEKSMRAADVLGDYLEKAKAAGSHEGEGTRGGHIIGHTQSGKPIYGATHPVYTQYEKPPKFNVEINPTYGSHPDAGGKMLQRRLPEHTKQDHLDAARAHKEAASATHHEHLKSVKTAQKKAYGRELGAFEGPHISGGVDPKFGEKTNDKIRTLATKKSDHSAIAASHERASKYLRNESSQKAEKSMKSEASTILNDYLEKGKSGGLATVEPDDDLIDDNPSNGGPFSTRNEGDDHGAGDSGETSWPKDAPKAAGSKRNAGDARGAGSSGGTSWPKDAPVAPKTDITYNKSQGSNYTQQELAHTVAHERALRKAQDEVARRGGPDVEVGRGVAPPKAAIQPLSKSYVVQRGLVQQMYSGSDARAAALAKSQDFYAAGRAPGIGLQPTSLTQGVLCKSCNSTHPALFSACPACGEGGLLQKSFHAAAVPVSLHGSAVGLRPAMQADAYVPSISLDDEG